MLEALGFLYVVPGLASVTLLGALIACVGLGVALEARSAWLLEHTAPLVLTFGGLLLLLSIPWLLLATGYLMRTIREVAQGSQQLPACDRWREMAGDGLKGTAFGLVVFGPVGTCWIVSLLAISCFAGGSRLAMAGGGLLLWPVTTLLILVGVVSGPAWLRLCVSRSLRESLNLRRAWRDLRRGWLEYLLCYLIQVLPSLVIQVLVLCVGASVVLLPLLLLLSVLTVIVQLYQFFVVPCLLAQYFRAYMSPPEPIPLRMPAALSLLAGGALLGFSLLLSESGMLFVALDTEFRSNLPVPGVSQPRANPYAAVDRHAESAAAADEESVENLAAYLRQDKPRDRARAAYRWITDRISYDASQTDADPARVLHTRRANSDGFARLFQRLAGGQLVVGSVRLGAFTDNGSDPRHVWNALKFDSQWHLVDPTWGAGRVKDKVFVKELNEFYFLANPRQLALTHFPDDPRWQLLTPPMSRPEFDEQPAVGQGFGWTGLNLVSPYRKAQARNARVVFDAPSDSAVDVRLDMGEDHFPVKPTREGQRYTVEATLPREGTGYLHVFASPPGADRYHCALSFELSSER